MSWVLIAATKSPGELFTTPTMAFGTGFLSNVSDLLAYRDGVFWLWLVNTFVYAGGGSLLATVVAAVSGYALAKYRFPGRALIFNLLIGGILVLSRGAGHPAVSAVLEGGDGGHVLGGAAAADPVPVQHLPRPGVRDRRHPGLVAGGRADRRG
ncbi:hypothetical protein ACFSTC_31565 [Nonomuraea ferruginea]